MAHRRPIRVLFSSFSVWGGVSRDEPRTVVAVVMMVAAVIATELARTAQMYAGIDPDDSNSAARSLAGYLSLQHVMHPEQGCPLPSLTPEIARADDAAKAAYQAGLLEIHATLRRLTATSEDAWTLMAQNVGAVMLARALPDERLQKEILAALRKAGESLLTDSPSRSINTQA